MGTVIPFPVKQRPSRQMTVDHLAKFTKTWLVGVRVIPPEERISAYEMLRREFPGEDPEKLTRCAGKLERIRAITDEAIARI